jgi:lysophospholipase L1-like esterase
MRQIGGILVTTFLMVAGCGGQANDAAGGDEAALGNSAAVYLALGDSIAFGYNPDDATNNPTSTIAFVGYPEEIAAEEKLFEDNAACEGETSGSMLDTAAPDNGCHGWRVAGDYMHVQYTSNDQSQLDYALEWLHTHPKANLITLGIGANDLLLLQAACNNSSLCILPKLPGTIATEAANVTAVLASLRGAGYFGKIVLVNYYATSYTDVLQLGAIPSLNSANDAVATAFGARVVDLFSAFALASGGDPCGAGLLYKIQTGPNAGQCDKHPSAKGRALIAHTIESVL